MTCTMAKRTKKPETKADSFEANLSFPQFNVRFTSADPLSSIRELTKMLRCLKDMDMSIETADLDDPLFFRFINISEEIRSNRDIMEFLRSVNKIEENFKQKKVSLENIKILDFANNSYTTSIDQSNISKKISHLLKGVHKSDYVVIHVIGSITKDEKQGIVDNIKNHLPNADIKELFTNKELLGKTVIEGIFFGDFEPN
jgi:hypothetical protein